MNHDVRDRVINRLRDKYPGLDNIIINCIADASEIAKEEEENQAISYTYCDNEYGEAARLIGLPKRVYEGDAGVDLSIVLSADEREHGKTIWPGERELLHTGLIAAFPRGYFGRIIHRSSTEKRSRLRIIEGTIDDYRGELMVQVHNGNQCRVQVQHGQRLAQLILCKAMPFPAEYRDELRPSDRKNRGFGSSGE